MKLLTVTGSFVPPDKVSYPDGTVVSLEARPQNDMIYYFDHWEGALSGTNPQATITMDSDKTVVMVFKACPVPIVPTYTLTTEVVGSGAVAPSGGVFQAGSGIILVASPSAQFVQWGGDASGTNQLLQLTMDSDKHVIATFGVAPPLTQLQGRDKKAFGVVGGIAAFVGAAIGAFSLYLYQKLTGS